MSVSTPVGDGVRSTTGCLRRGPRGATVWGLTLLLDDETWLSLLLDDGNMSQLTATGDAGLTQPGRSDGRPLLRGWLHAATTPLAMAGAWLLSASATGGSGRLSVLVFGACLVGLYTTSSLYHVGAWSARARRLLARCDGAMIQLFIAATFTPIAFHALHGGWRTWSLALAWLVAATGAVIAASPLQMHRWVGTSGYIAVGWLCVVPFVKIATALPWQGSGLIVLGGVLYTVGGVIYANRWPDPLPSWFGYHEVFHLFVIAGSTAHYLAIWRYVLPLA